MLRIMMVLTLAAAICPLAVHADTPEFTLVIRDHRFEPARLEVPANIRVRLIVNNQDSTPEEFESYELNREKVIPGNTQATIFVGPLEPGEYSFFGEFNIQTAQGVLIASP
jgi:hypothetical protein